MYQWNDALAENENHPQGISLDSTAHPKDKDENE